MCVHAVCGIEQGLSQRDELAGWNGMGTKTTGTSTAIKELNRHALTVLHILASRILIGKPHLEI